MTAKHLLRMSYQTNLTRISIFCKTKYFCKNVCYIEILVNFAVDSASEEADAASQNQLLLMVDFCPLKRYIN